LVVAAHKRFNLASERGNRLRDGPALQTTGRRAPGEVHGRFKPLLVAKAGEA
jgi:hypothetical protein